MKIKENSWDAAKAMARRKLMPLNAYIREH